ncbi:Papain inhibitor [Pseudocercospora fuligena]|uniref:Papain inhibitor n=1 Tax=Pseudocercospora fuligena TaxID=685502 RepID=A0A8H6R779_9PEZI|nr:Papain inhibitor [Pseudocercospora fuligena]
MFTNSIIAATGALLTLVAAVPMADQHPHHHHHPAHKRDYVWVTHTEVAIETVPVTKTVWIEPGETPPTHHKKPEPYGAPASSSSSSSPAPPAYTPPASSSSSSSAPPPPAYTPPAPTTPTSTYVAPAPTTPSTTAVPTTYAAPSSSSAPAPASYGGSSSGGSSGALSYGIAKSGTSFTGDLTWYDVGMGACGETSTADQPIVAISEAIFDSYPNGGNPNNSPLCGKYLTITGKDGKAHKAKIVDRCPGCKESDLDLSQDFFNLVTNNGDGRVGGMSWTMD